MLRILQESDLELILLWRNAPAIRQAMFTQHEITLEEHLAWFQRIRVDAGVRCFLFLDKEGIPCGVVSFTGIDVRQSNAFWGFYAKPLAMPGTGMRLSLDALNYAFGELGLYKVNAEVLGSNPRSIEMHKKVGFIEEGRFREHFFNGEERVDVIRLGLLATEWPSCRTLLESRIAERDTLELTRAFINPNPENT
ncbi:MAG: UDP-4-amino-4,6-dideoxy-N-acetyl-beta-L-altrosamine N-acetyltransferase [Saprospiraceae bacterium]